MNSKSRHRPGLFGGRVAHVRFGSEADLGAVTNSLSLWFARDDCFENSQSIGGAVCFTLFKILFRLRHGIRNVGKAENFSVCNAGECIESGSLHFDRKDAL